MRVPETGGSGTRHRGMREDRGKKPEKLLFLVVTRCKSITQEREMKRNANTFQKQTDSRLAEHLLSDIAHL
jgi:hypothetical protein